MNTATPDPPTESTLSIAAAKTMKAVVQDRYGSSEVLELRDYDKPDIGDHEVLIRVRAAGVNPWRAPSTSAKNGSLRSPANSRIWDVIAASEDDVPSDTPRPAGTYGRPQRPTSASTSH